MATASRSAFVLAAALLAACMIVTCATADAQTFQQFRANHPATPGASLSFIKVGEKKSHEGKPGIEFNILAVGLPPDNVYFLWQGNGLDAPTRLPNEMAIGEGGYLVARGGSIPLSLLLHTFARAEGQDYALMTSDGTMVAYGRVIPFPVEAKDGKRHIWVEMLTEYVFAIHGEGFEPGEKLQTRTSIDGNVSQSDSTFSEKGFVTLLSLRGMGKGYGQVTYTVESSTAILSVTFDWGPPALRSGP